MHRRPLLDLLAAHADASPADGDLAARFVAFVQAHEDCLLRTCVPGHITASAWIVSADGQDVLLTHHRKLDRWLQLGGHVDGEADVLEACLREAIEESGMPAFDVLGHRRAGRVLPLDLDVHPIPARGHEPAHEHWDVRFLLRARPGSPLVLSAESKALEWVPAAQLERLTQEESVLRLRERARAFGVGG
jgi:8-oxo-dGTP pyrophosphatase MutT (NUDIX family)